ncbi:hypothetical protein HHUSO_G35331 [Huso huso]|uniref:Tetratricopeptide repeat protein 24 n=1 Tax=Huso huso TaxID=61971 RepID=A0ABR0Y3I0_HUSHU
MMASQVPPAPQVERGSRGSRRDRREEREDSTARDPLQLQADIEALTAAGHRALLGRDTVEALACFKKAFLTSLQLKEAQVQRACAFNLGAAYVEVGKPEKGLGFLQRSQPPGEGGEGVGEKRADLHFNLGAAHDALGQHATAAEHYRQAAEQYGSREGGRSEAEARMKLGYCHLQMKEPGMAARSFQRAGECYRAAGCVEPAATALREAANHMLQSQDFTAGEIEHVLGECKELCERIHNKEGLGELGRVSTTSRGEEGRGELCESIHNKEGLGELCESIHNKEGRGELCERIHNKQGRGELCESVHNKEGLGEPCESIYNKEGRGELCESIHNKEGLGELCESIHNKEGLGPQQGAELCESIHNKGGAWVLLPPTGSQGNRSAQGQCFCNLAFALSQLEEHEDSAENYLHALQAFRDTVYTDSSSSAHERIVNKLTDAIQFKLSTQSRYSHARGIQPATPFKLLPGSGPAPRQTPPLYVVRELRQQGAPQLSRGPQPTEPQGAQPEPGHRGQGADCCSQPREETSQPAEEPGAEGRTGCDSVVTHPDSELSDRPDTEPQYQTVQPQANRNLNNTYLQPDPHYQNDRLSGTLLPTQRSEHLYETVKPGALQADRDRPVDHSSEISCISDEQHSNQTASRRSRLCAVM